MEKQLKAQPVQEPAGYAYVIFTENACNGKKTWQFVMGRSLRHDAPIRNVDKLYTTLVAQPVQPAPLTDEQIMAIAAPFIRSVGGYSQHEDAIPDNGAIEDFARAIEAAVRTGGAG